MRNEAQWPDDVDGDVFRRMDASGFDFTSECNIDFNIDVETWPPPDPLLKQLRQRYTKVEVVEPGDDHPGYITFVVKAKLSYELVTSIQRTASEIAKPYGGNCESWGVLH